MRHGSSSSSKLKALINMATTRITLESTALELREGRGGFGFPPARSRQMPPAGFSPLTLSCEALERSAFRLGLKNTILRHQYVDVSCIEATPVDVLLCFRQRPSGGRRWRWRSRRKGREKGKKREAQEKKRAGVGKKKG